MNIRKRIDIFSISTLLKTLFVLIIYFVFAESVLQLSDTKNTLNDIEYYASTVFSKQEWKEAEKFRNDLLKIGIRGRMIKDTVIYNYRPASSDTVNFNSYGFRGKEINKKESDEYRIAIVGASRIWGNFLPDDKTIPVIVEKDIRSKFPDKNITVLNLGVEGSDLQRGIATAKKFHEKLEVDMYLFYSGFTDTGYSYIFGNVDWIPFSHDSYMDEKIFSNLVHSMFPDKWWQKSKVLNLAVTSAKTELDLTVIRNSSSKNLNNTEIPEEKKQSAKDFPSTFFNRMEEAHEYFKKKSVEQIFILPATVQVKKTPSELEKKIMSSFEMMLPGYNSFLKKCYEGTQTYFSENEHSFIFVDQSTMFDKESSTVYYDGMHVSPHGSRIIANSITEILSKFFMKEDSEKDLDPS